MGSSLVVRVTYAAESSYFHPMMTMEMTMAMAMEMAISSGAATTRSGSSRMLSRSLLARAAKHDRRPSEWRERTFSARRALRLC